MSLKVFHLLFILVSILGADLFGVWSVWNYTQTQAIGILTLGVLSLVGGLGLLIYAFRLYKRLDGVSET